MNDLQDVGEARPEALVAFMPLVLDKLLLLMVKPPTIGGKDLSFWLGFLSKFSVLAGPKTLSPDMYLLVKNISPSFPRRKNMYRYLTYWSKNKIPPLPLRNNI